MLNERTIEKLEQMGFKRWQKNGMDRLYINPKEFGLVVEQYKSGNVSYAELNGEQISNGSATDILCGKYYVDAKTGNIIASARSYKDTIIEIITEMIERAQA